MVFGPDGASTYWRKELVRLLEFDGEEAVEGVFELDATIIGAPLSHCRLLR
ncbi:MAG: hypothetical protein FWD68_21800 [Alphaproteobacteria bacterium]|nr:hypothetical protein [Alphaproteobacteria bacterium]